MVTANGVIFFVAGFFTTAHTLSSLMYHLAKNPDVQDNILEEIREVLDANAQDKINHDNIKDMHYLEAAINETLRMNAPISEHDRTCTADCEIRGMKIKKGTRIQVNSYGEIRVNVVIINILSPLDADLPTSS